MGPPPPRTGTFSPNNPQALQTGSSHSPHPSLTGGLSAGASPSTSSPTGTSVSKISIAQVYLLLSTIKEDKDDPNKWDLHTEQLRKLIDDNGMEVFTRYFARLVAGNASQIFPGISRPGSNAGNIHILAGEMRKIAHEPEQAHKIAESIEQGTEDIFRDFDLSTFMEHFKLDPLEKTILALAFKLGTRSDLRTKADAILSTNYPTFLNILSRPTGEHADLSPSFISLIIDRFIQEHPPTFTTQAKSELILKVSTRFAQADQTPPPEVMAALDLLRILGDKSANALTMYIKKTGAEFTRDPDVCLKYLQNRPSNAPLGEELVANSLMYTTISQAPKHNPAVLVRALRQVVSSTFRWQAVVSCFDHCDSRVSSEQFLRLFNALVPVAQEDTSFDIQQLWGGNWENTEAQLSFICALTSLGPEQLDITSVPGVQTTLTLDAYSQSAPAVRERASVAVKHPLVSMAAILAIFHVALKSTPASDTPEAKRLFQQVVVPNLDIFVVSAFNVPKPWPGVTDETLTTLFDNFLYERSPWYDFVLDSLWRKDSAWVRQRLVDAHALRPHELPYIFKHAVNHRWIDQLVSMTTGFGLDLAAMAHAEGRVDFAELARNSGERQQDLARYLLQFLAIKAEQELKFQRQPDGNVPIRTTTPLRVKTVYVLLSMLSDFLPKHQPIPELIRVQRTCITVYPRLINYGGDFDDIIDANGREGNALPPAANAKMELHYKKMYSDEVEVREIVQVLENYKRSRDSLDQDIFACMIHGLFDEYIHFAGYPLEALATTAVLFGGIIAQKLIADIPLEVGLGMILQAVQENTPNEAMYKFGLQALMQLFGRLKEWPGFCAQLLQVPGLQGTEAWKKAEDVIRTQEESMATTRNGGDALTNGNAEEGGDNEHHPPPFTAINVDRRPADAGFEDPDDDTQGKIQFVLNNITENTLQAMFKELAEMLERGHKQWFASHLVEERAKMQPNYHDVYLKLVEQFGDKSLWAEVLRETYISVSRILNAEATAHNSTDRMHLKNLGGWLGLLTLARDKPIKHKNIAFKQLLMEAHDTKRLLVVIPFVCKVLIQGKKSTVFQKQNPWLMDIIHLLIELYHNAELKLNLKFEIEVLCKGLELDHKSIEPSGELLNRVMAEDAVDLLPADTLEPFENLSLNGLAPGVGSGLSPHAVAPSIPDLTPFLQIPPVNEMVVSHERMTQITNQAITKALSDIIGPVVDRSVTIAAISTQQMIHKDFGTEPDENRVRTSAINMVKATAGSLALVTSREPLRVNIGNYMRSLSSDLPQGLPEGNIHMAVNMNLDLASREIEKAAEERAVPEIEEMLELELEARRRHRATRPNEPYVDAGLSRWAWTIPNPYKLSPNMSGLNPEQMAIYENFARQQPRTTAASAPPAHAPSQSDASRSLANEVLQDQYNSVPTLPTPAETPAIPPMGSQQIGPYSSQQHSSNMVNGRQHGLNLDARALAERVQKFLLELQRVAMDAEEEHFSELPRPHQILDIVDALVQLLIKAQQASEDLSVYAAELISQSLFSNPVEKSLVTETFVHVLNTLRKIASPALNLRVTNFFQQQTGEHLRNLTLISSLVNTDLLNWRHVDNAMAAAIKERKSGSIEFLEKVMDLTVFNDTPVLLFVEFVHSLDEAWTWIQEDSELAEGKSLQDKVLAPANEPRPGLSDDDLASLRQDQMEYVFEEWVRLFTNPWASEKFGFIFVQQMYGRGVISSKDDIATFTRIAMEKSVDICELNAHAGGSVSDGYLGVDSLSRLVNTLMKLPVENPSSGQVSRLAVLECALSVSVLLANHHHMTRGELFNQRVFFRFFSVLLHEIGSMENVLSEEERHDITLLFARRLDDLGPSVMPGFVYAWVSLLQHKEFLPFIFKVPGNAGWPLFTRLLTQLLSFIGEQLKALNVSNLAKDLYRGTLKFMLVLQHDFPDYLAANYIEICRSIPPHCTQLTNMVLVATPNTHSKMPDPLHSGVQVDRIDESREPPVTMEDPTEFLRQAGLQGVLDQCLQSGPSEDAIAHITHAINRPETRYTIYGNVPLSVNLAVIEAVVAYLGLHAVLRVQKGGQPFISKASDISTLSILVHELSPEGRYFVLSNVVHRLRYANAHTTFFSQALLEIFGTDMADTEETEIRQQICRILLERLVGFFPQPWGLLVTVAELIKNDKYQFFELPFIKSSPDVAERFVTILASRRDFAM